MPPFPGGAAVADAHIALSLAARGHTLRTVSPIVGSGDIFAARHPELRVCRYRLPRYITVNHPRVPDDEIQRSMEEIRAAVAGELESGRPEVALLGREWDGVPILGDLRARNIPYLVIAHGGIVHGLARNTFPEILDEGSRRVLKDALAVVAVASHVQASLGALGFHNTIVIENTVDLDRFRPEPKPPALLGELGIAPDDVVVAHFSNLKAVKRPIDVVESAAIALAAEPKLLYLMVGDGELRGEVEAACARRGVSGRFRFPGWVGHERIPDYLNLADIVISPSEAEGMSLAHLEAQACGRLLIASRIAATRDLVDEGVTGLLFRVGDPADLAAKTLLAAGDPHLRETIGRNAAAARRRAGGLDRWAGDYERALLAAATGRL